MTFVTIEKVSKKYDKHTAVDDINLAINKGERFGLIGPNGAGKSALINMIAGLLDADSASIHIDGVSIKEDHLYVKAKIGVVPQEIALIESMNAYDNLEFFGRTAFVGYMSDDTGVTFVFKSRCRIASDASSAQEQTPSFVAWYTP